MGKAVRLHIPPPSLPTSLSFRGHAQGMEIRLKWKFFASTSRRARETGIVWESATIRSNPIGRFGTDTFSSQKVEGVARRLEIDRWNEGNQCFFRCHGTLCTMQYPFPNRFILFTTHRDTPTATPHRGHRVNPDRLYLPALIYLHALLPTLHNRLTSFVTHKLGSVHSYFTISTWCNASTLSDMFQCLLCYYFVKLF